MKKTPARLIRIYDFGMQVAYAAAILLLPLTSLPILSRLMGGTMVAPPTIVCIFLLTIGWLPYYLLRGGKIPGEMRPFIVFFVVAMIASAAAFFIYFPPLREFTPQAAEVSALLTLAIGSATYVVISLWNQESSRLVLTLRLINISGLVMLAWSFIQLTEILLNSSHYPDLMVRLQALLSTSSLLELGFRGRVIGFTFEPSWQAHVLNLVYLPYWLAASVTNYSASRKFWHLSVENGLFLGGIIILYFTISRIGLLAFLLAFAFLFYHLNTQAVRWLRKRMHHRSIMARLHLDELINLMPVLIIGLVYLVGVGGLLVLWAHFDSRTAQLLSLRAIPANLYEFAFKVNFGERVIYWSMGWSVFAQHPLMGVGLGNTGFFIQQYLPKIAYRSPEIISLLDRVILLPNIKSYWIRLLSETGLVGFSVFATWQIVLWRAGTFLRAEHAPILRTLGWMAAFAILVFLFEGFSVDSFALPYLWVAMGLITAASALAKREAGLIRYNT